MNSISKCEAKFQNSRGNIYSNTMAKRRRTGNSLLNVQETCTAELKSSAKSLVLAHFKHQWMHYHAQMWTGLHGPTIFTVSYRNVTHLLSKNCHIQQMIESGNKKKNNKGGKTVDKVEQSIATG